MARDSYRIRSARFIWYVLAVGIVAMIAIQVMINVGVVTGLMPVTGITCRFKLWWIEFDFNVNGSRCIIKYKSPFSLLNPVYKTGFSYV